MDTDLRGHFTYLGHMKDTSSVILKCTNCKKELRGKGNNEWNFTRHMKAHNRGRKHSEALPLELWTCFSRESVIAVKVHFIDSAWELRSDVLAFATFEVVHTGKNTENKVESLLHNHDLTPEHISFVMADNAANMVKAFKVPSAEQQEWKSVVHLKKAERSIAEDDSGDDEGSEDEVQED
ncbi:hypothetical protein V5799_031708 [Amblyomma americanum]|uniref:BED-type domain-containing protein n=1 Tax=Amblyomma americanum TaxID=6943 RepID=A0AAQ4DT93_AMBAM